MNFMFSNQWTKIAVIAVSLSAILGATACGGKAKKADRAPSERRSLQTNTPTPTGEILKDSPCGNPDWAKPPGSKGPEPADADFRATKREKSADNKPADKQEQSDDAQDSVEDTADSTD